MSSKRIPFRKKRVKAYLDGCIRLWRKIRDNSEMEKQVRAIHYVDAFQSVRTSLFGELLDADKEDKKDTVDMIKTDRRFLHKNTDMIRKKDEG